MTDTATATPTDTGAVTSELAHALPEDNAIWEKHFGKEAKGKVSTSDSKESKSRGRASSASDSRDSKDSERSSSKEASRSDSAATDENKETRSKTSKTSPAVGKDEKSSKSSDAKEKPEASSKDAKAEKEETGSADPEAPLKKARDLYQEAKKAEDPKEARKLYKRAIKEAFGEIPDEFSDSRFAAARTRDKAAHAAVQAKAQEVEKRIGQAAEQLKPAIYVMQQLKGAGIADQLTVPLVEKAVRVIKALRPLEEGDFTALAEVVAQAAGVDHDEAMKRFVRGVKVSPEGKAARQAAERAQQESQALRERLQQLEAKLAEKDTQQTEAQKRAQAEREQTENRERYLSQIEEELDGHPVLKLPRGKERVMAMIVRTADKKLKAPTMSFEQAANRIVAHEKKRLAETRFLEDGGEPPPREEPRGNVRRISRTDTSDGGIRQESPEAAFERIYGKHMGGRR